MTFHALRTSPHPDIAERVRRRIRTGGERLWTLADFRGMSFTAVAQALSRLTRSGEIQRVRKGVYYRTRDTAFGPSRPNPAAILRLAACRKTFFPAGTVAANLLGFSTQSSPRGELATSGLSLPRKLVGEDAIIHTRRPESWVGLSEQDAALLDFLRRGGRTSELSPEETIRKTVALLAEGDRYHRLRAISESEPPRVRALLGALGEQMRRRERELAPLRASLNPLSCFDFGLFSALPNARSWQAKRKAK